MIAAVFGMGLAAGNGDVALLAGFYAAHHTLVKGGLFLAVGVVQVGGARLLWPVLLPAGVLALGLGGLPLTGGALAKLVVKAPVGDGIVGSLVSLSSAGTTLLMLHFMRRLAAPVRDAAPGPPARLALPCLAMAVASVLVLWAIYLTVMGGTVSDAAAPGALWSAIWPLLLGGVLAGAAARLAAAAGAALERLDIVLRQWPVAGISLLAVVVILTALMLAGH